MKTPIEEIDRLVTFLESDQNLSLEDLDESDYNDLKKVRAWLVRISKIQLDKTVAELKKPDRNQCQSEIKEGSFMTLGPRKFLRCKKKPVLILKEIEKGKDGKRGSMSLCQDCFEVFKLKFPQYQKQFSQTKLPIAGAAS